MNREDIRGCLTPVAFAGLDLNLFQAFSQYSTQYSKVLLEIQLRQSILKQVYVIVVIFSVPIANSFGQGKILDHWPWS